MQVIVVDDHPLILDAMQQALTHLDPMVQVLTASRCRTALELATRHAEVELVLLDFNLPDLSGIPALRAWRQRFPALPIVVISGDEDRQTIVAVMSAGAAGFIPKSYSSELMLSALRMVLAGGRFVPPEILTGTQRQWGKSPSPAGSAVGHQAAIALSPRQRAVLTLMAQGMPNKVIARELDVSERTVKAHLTEVFRAFKVVNRSQAILAAVRFGLVAGVEPVNSPMSPDPRQDANKKPA